MDANDLRVEIKRHRASGHDKHGCMLKDHDAYVRALEQYALALETAIEGESAAYETGYRDGFDDAWWATGEYR